MEFEPTISAGERPQTIALDRATTGIGIVWTWSSKVILLKDYEIENSRPLACDGM
jgi:hypothetical protein